MKVEDIMTGNRVCLQPKKWQTLYDAVKEQYPDRYFPKPPIQSEWNNTADSQKRIRFCMLLEFAIISGIAKEILNEVEEKDWYYKEV